MPTCLDQRTHPKESLLPAKLAPCQARKTGRFGGGGVVAGRCGGRPELLGEEMVVVVEDKLVEVLVEEKGVELKGPLDGKRRRRWWKGGGVAVVWELNVKMDGG
ncbi:hypothetical protein LIER_33857 [Lithospermum erythrorhizon]|uniref:Uncharacterized protein n=1 Tax=Lithospermum erythrorhizon TaxID=34254 RepID=A0AAV3S044_LITER